MEQLVRELRDEVTAEPRPVIFEVPINRGESLHLIVVWSEWEGVAPQDRTAIIEDAYTAYDEDGNPGEPLSPKITLVIGATPDEAIGHNLLPFTVIPNMARNDLAYETVRQAMKEEGAIDSRFRTVLAFPTLQMAEEACKRLREKTRETMPSLTWHIGEQYGQQIDED